MSHGEGNVTQDGDTSIATPAIVSPIDWLPGGTRREKINYDDQGQLQVKLQR